MSNSWDSMDSSLPSSSVHGIFPVKNTGVGCYFLFHSIFLTQGSNLCLLHCQAGSLLLSHQGDLIKGIPKPPRPMTGILVKRGNLDTETDTQKEGNEQTQREKMAMRQEWCICNWRGPLRPEARRRAWSSSLPSIFREIIVLPTPWFWTFGL